MTSRLKSLKPKLREAIHDGRRYIFPDKRGLKGFFLYFRSLSDKNGMESSRPYTTRENTGAHGAHKHLQNGSALREAVASLICRLHQGFSVSSHNYVDILQGCFQQKDLDLLKQVHNCIKKSELEQHPYVASNLLKCYIGCGRLQRAHELFNTLSNRDIVGWNTMIRGFAENDQVEDAIEVYKQLRNQGGQPNAITYLNALKACASPLSINWGRDIHAHIIQDGFLSDVRVCNALVHMYAKCGSVDDAKIVFDKILDRTVISWNGIINGLAQHGHGLEAFSLFCEMQRKGFTPNSTTFLCILNARADQQDLTWVKEVHSHATKLGFAQDERVNNALIHMYAKCGSVDDARSVFDSMMSRSVISWNIMIGGLARHGRGHEAFSCFHQMQSEGVVPDSATYLSILSANACEGALAWVKEVHSHAAKSGLNADLRVDNALVHMYAKSGSIEDAKAVFDKMERRDVISWTVMIGGLAQYGKGREAVKLFEDMKLKGVEPSGPLFLAVLSACSHAGLVDEGRLQFVSMTQYYGIEPTLEHFSCMLDVYGRAGHLEEARLFIFNMTIKPDTAAWKALSGACRTYGNFLLAELAAKECISLEPMNPSAYVLLSNIYAAKGDWDKKFSVRRMMEEKGIRKDPGRSWIVIDKKIHHFVSGDSSHPETRKIYAMLNSLFNRLKAEGYIPDTRLVFFNINDEHKESVLSFHSEKLAIAYGLMHVPTAEPVRIYKNLRMCRDCHTASKLISKVTGREIVARDAKRFHHFKDGVCACGDYW